MRDAVSRILASDLFAGTPRLREFLEFVSNEAILGNQDRLRAKSIAQSVYGRDLVDERSSANVVRVEARRLRRLLADYYDTEGLSDPVRVFIDKGGYAPRFERASPAPAAAPATSSSMRSEPASSLAVEPSGNPRPTVRWVVAALCIAGLAAVSLLYTQYKAPTHETLTKAEMAEREALMELSPAALEAANLTAQARGLIYPVFDPERQRLTAELFRTATTIDPNAAGAYAGLAQTLASLALLSISGPQHDAYLSDANANLERALELDPSSAWSQSAAGWVAFVESDFEKALRHSERAVALSPDDGNALDFYGVIAIMSGEWEKALFAGTQERQRTGSNTRYADRNILAAARFHLGDHEEAARIIEDNTITGGPLSAPVVMYLAASYHALGREEDGRRMVSLLEEDWPGLPIDIVLKRLHRDDKNAMEVLDRLRALGWQG